MQVAGVVSRLDEAMAREPDFDLAVLDVHLNGKSVFDFADKLAARGHAFRLRHRLWRARHSRTAPGPAGAAKAVLAGRPEAALARSCAAPAPAAG